MDRILLSIFLCFILGSINGQNIFIYQPRSGESIKIYNSDKKPFNGKPLHFRQGEKFTIRLLNPNTLFYKYEVKYESQKEESEDKEITDALALLNTALASRVPGGALDPTYDQYNGAINTLMADIKLAQQIIDHSDVPELEDQALRGDRTSGLKYAVDQISGKAQPGMILQLSDAQYRFRSPTLTSDLTSLMNKINGLDDVLKSALTLLNSSLVQNVNRLKNSLLEISSEIDSYFVVTDTTTKVLLSITASNTENADLSRAVTMTDAPMEIVTIVPDYKRSTLELVPVGNFLFAKDVKEFYAENGLVQSHLKNQTTFAAGAVLNVNIASFGYSKEMSAGIGLGYKFEENNNTLSNLYFSTLFSYKNFFRIGFGFGFASYPNALKNGIIEGQQFPSNISNIEDVIDYKEKPTAFLTLAFAGINLTKKK